MKIFRILPLFLSLASVADDSRAQFFFQGNTEEKVELENSIYRETTREESYEGTCQRQIPYEEVECTMVNRPERVCRIQPAERVCRDVPDQECRTVTRTRRQCQAGPSRQECRNLPDREECRNGPDRQECRNTPDRQQCSVGPSRQECRQTPDRQQCREIPAREQCREVGGTRQCRTIPASQECRTVPGERQCREVPGERTCQTIPGERVCRTVPGERICRNIPGERQCRDVAGPEVCRDIAYEDRECRTIERRQCQDVPAREVCAMVDRPERVCGPVTRYRSESYACTRTRQVPHRELVSTFVTDIVVQVSAGEAAQGIVKIHLDEAGKIHLRVEDQSEEAMVFFAHRMLKQEGEKIEGIIQIKAIALADILALYTQEIKKLRLRKNQMSFTVAMPGLPDSLEVEAVVSQEGKALSTQMFKSEHLVIGPIKKGRAKITAEFGRSQIDLKALKRIQVNVSIQQHLPPGNVVNENKIEIPSEPLKAQVFRLHFF